MKVSSVSLDDLESSSFAVSCLALGFFDGVHRGHQDLLSQGFSLASELGVSFGVLTFDVHPLEVLGKISCFEELSPLETKLHLLEGSAVSQVFVLKTDKNLVSLSPAEFIERVLLKLGAKGVVVGEDFRFGAGAQGDVFTLQDCPLFTTRIVPLSCDSHGHKFASRSLRSLVRDGFVEAAASLLGHPFLLVGEVVSGDARGRQIGFRTANLSCARSQLLPLNGVYVVHAFLDGAKYLAVCNVGVRPSFGGGSRFVECHLLDYSGKDFYAKTLALEFVKRLRDERKFGSVEELKAQIERDVLSARSTKLL